MDDSAVVFHDAPSPLEVCSICHEVVGVHEVFRCICDDPSPGLQTTVKCQACKFWSQSACVGNPNDFTCQLCSPAGSITGTRISEPAPASPTDTSEPPTSRGSGGGSSHQSPARGAESGETRDYFASISPGSPLGTGVDSSSLFNHTVVMPLANFDAPELSCPQRARHSRNQPDGHIPLKRCTCMQP
ncbi:hypothetical protein DFH09DRAFT_1304526 [Mycena vulgaris]|nr:hypothetical protein DFH09DRAFT_1304526 [Mycena vulgaris]